MKRTAFLIALILLTVIAPARAQKPASANDAAKPLPTVLEKTEGMQSIRAISIFIGMRKRGRFGWKSTNGIPSFYIWNRCPRAWARMTSV